MGLFSNIMNASAASSAGSILTDASTGTSLTSVYPGNVVAIGQSSPQTWITTTSTQSSMAVSILGQYCQLIGWELMHLYIPNIDSNDPKVAILKLAKEGEVIKDVGVRISDHNFYIMRDPAQNE